MVTAGESPVTDAWLTHASDTDAGELLFTASPVPGAGAGELTKGEFAVAVEFEVIRASHGLSTADGRLVDLDVNRMHGLRGEENSKGATASVLFKSANVTLRDCE